jgi:uncharacterized protein YegP (UPF0339 family)
MAYFALLRDESKKYRWELRGNNNEIVVRSEYGFTRRVDAIDNIIWVKLFAWDAVIILEDP